MEPSLIKTIFSSVSSAGVFFSVFSVGNPDPDILKTLYTKIYGTLLTFYPKKPHMRGIDLQKALIKI